MRILSFTKKYLPKFKPQTRAFVVACLGTLLVLVVVYLALNRQTKTTADETPAALASHVLVVGNSNNAQSIALVDYYMAARGIPATNKLLVSWTADDNAELATQAQYNALSSIILAKAAALPNIDYILMVRNLPSRVSTASGTRSVDSLIASKNQGQRLGPYFMADVQFSSKTYNEYLVTRLDGLTWADSYALIDRSLAASAGGTIFLDEDPAKTGGFASYNNQLTAAYNYLVSAGIPVEYNTAASFINPGYAMAGYTSWGSNDSHYSATVYNSLTFRPGALAETAVSTSARSLRTSPSGQSLINVLIKNGVTGVKGYVSEPFLSAIADPSIMFARYTTGRNLAESFYSASRYVGWMDIVIGDPLCSPYTGFTRAEPTSTPTLLPSPIPTATPSPTPTPTPTTTSVPTPTPISSVASVTLVSSASPTTGMTGTIVTYDLQYHNVSSSNATNVVIYDPIPVGTTYVAGSASNAGRLNGSTLEWNIGTIAAGDSSSVTFRVTIN